jgi:hypothetical protein
MNAPDAAPLFHERGLPDPLSGVWTSDMRLVPILVRRDVPAPGVVTHRYVFDVQGFNRRRVFNGAEHCDVSGVYFLLN